MFSAKELGARVFMKSCSLLPLQDKVVFSSFCGSGFGVNPRMIFKEMQRRHLDVQCIWLLRNRIEDITGVKSVRVNSFEALYHLATAKLWIDDSRKPEWMVKRKGQFYVHTWHGDVCLKKIEKDAEDVLSEEYVRAAKHDSEMADLMISGSKFRTNNYRSSFWYDGEILELGAPESDIFYQNPAPIRKKVYKYYHLPDDVQVALYVPTFRVNHRIDVYDMDYKAIIEELTLKYGGKWIIIVRLHPAIQDLQGKLFYSETVLNGSTYEDSDELIVASIVILTDYSSCMFQALEARKKVFLYATDLDEYVNEDRGFYWNLDELPFPLAQSNEELRANIRNFDELVYSDRCEQLRQKIGYFNSDNSSEKVTDAIIERVWGKDTL